MAHDASACGGPSMSHASMWGRRLAVLLLLLLLLPGGEVGGEAPLAGLGAPLPLALLLPLALPACATRAERSVSPALPSAAGAPLSPWPSSCAQPLGRSGRCAAVGPPQPPPAPAATRTTQSQLANPSRGGGCTAKPDSVPGVS